MDNGCLNIKNINSINITKVKDWAIYFDYEDKHYLIIGSSEFVGKSWQDLCERKFDGKKYYSKLIKRKFDEKEYVKNDYIEKQKNKNIIYSLINKKYFTYKLTQKGFFNGVYEKEIKQEKIKVLKEQLKNKEKECLDIKNKILILSNF